MRPRPHHGAFALAILAVAACSGDGTDLDASAAATTPPAVAPDASAGQGDPTGGTSPPPATESPSTDADEGTGGRVVTAPPVVDVPETGVPGLDSEDRFCSAWSRFAGSFQVIAVTAAFGEGPPEQVATLEVLAAPVVTAAYDDLVAAWPDELAAERGVAADRLLGPFAARLAAGVEALTDAGASSADVDAISAAWLAALAARDPSTPEFGVELADDLWSTVDAATAEFVERRPAFSADDSLVTAADTPLTDEYLALNCPDQGTLGGGEVDAG